MPSGAPACFLPRLTKERPGRFRVGPFFRRPRAFPGSAAVAELSLQDFYQEKRASMMLSLLAGAKGLARHRIAVPDIYRPGLALAGYFNFFAYERMQILGRTELRFLDSLSAKRRQAHLEKFFSYPLRCLIVTQGLKPPAPLLKLAQKKGVPVFCSKLPTTRMIVDLTIYLEEKLAPQTVVHGTLVEVYGLGLLILGKSGIGKSECALELVKRGHRLVADDLVHLKRSAEQVLVGWGDPLLRHHMEVRGLGVIDIKELFGIGAVKGEVAVEMAVTIEEWVEGKEYDRLGLDTRTHTILGVPLPSLLLPVRPGRNLSVILEVAAMNQRLKRSGHHSAQLFNRKVMEWMGQKPEK